jgi:ATP-dependent DNA helicase DinG
LKIVPLPDSHTEIIAKRFTPGAAFDMAEAIEAAGGNEVLFAGALNSVGVVETVRVVARGNDSAVTALFEQLEVRDVVIHNHPSGALSPSDADLHLASAYGAHGHGVYIVDNHATEVYVVVEPFLQKDVTPLNVRAMHGALHPNGALAQAMPGYELRPQQEQMIDHVANAFNRDGIAVVEAPTGVGKTMAYLMPAAEWAVNNKERVVISTRTINLQEQIIQKDLPLLQRALGTKLKGCLVKGRGNYLCLRKLERAMGEAQLFDEPERKEQLQHIAEWSETTENGSLAELPFVPARGLWEEVCSEADACSFGRCPDKKRCFVGKARREAATADLLVVNHHMLFSDLAIKQETGSFSALAVLPAYKRLIFDEAHSIEDAATEYFGVSATLRGTHATLGRLHRTERGRDRGLLPLLRARLVKDCKDLNVRDFEHLQEYLDTQLLPNVGIARHETTNYFQALRSLAGNATSEIGRDVKWRLTQQVLDATAVREFHAAHAAPFVEQFQLLSDCLRAFAEKASKALDKGDEENLLAGDIAELRAYAVRIDRVGLAVSELTSPKLAENTVRWVEIDANDPQTVRTARCPLEVGPPLVECLYNQLKSVVMTSATLTVGGEFDYLNARLGLDGIERGRLDTGKLDSPFDYAEQSMLLVPTDFPEPTDRAFDAQCPEYLYQLIRASRGRAFVLFTAYGPLDRAHTAIEARLKADGITPLKQGQLPRTALIERFRADTSSVLFATDSFWEGVDVAGEALESVILVKLPFRVPSEPVLQARCEAIDAAGGNSFMDYSVPQAAIRLRQGAGRLIRRRSDRGVVVVLDKRILTKRYGKVFLNSLPGMPLHALPAAEIPAAIAKFLERE